MKRYSRMIIMLLALVLGHAALTAGSLRAGQDEAELFRTALREEAAAVFEQHGYAEFLPILEQRRRAAQNEAERNYVTYYQLLTQSSYLDYLEQKEIWKEYYELRKEYDAHIIATVQDIPKKYPVEAVVVDMQFLSWRAQLREEDDAGAAASFNELADMLFSFTAAAGPGEISGNSRARGASRQCATAERIAGSLPRLCAASREHDYFGRTPASAGGEIPRGG